MTVDLPLKVFATTRK